MAQNRTDNFSINAPKDIDQRKLKNGTTPYASVDEAHSLIAYKYRTMTCIVMNGGVPTEYWYRDATTSSTDLVVKNQSTISSIAGLQTELDGKAETIDLSDIAISGSYTDLVDAPTYATVAITGSYLDLANKPTIPAAQVSANWTSSSGVTQILNKPVLATVATTGSYDDLTNKPLGGTGPTSTTELTEGTNLYFTQARVRTTPLTGFSSTTGSITSADTVLSAVNKLNGNVATKQNTITTGTSSQVLKGDLSLGALSTVGATGAYSDLTGKPSLATVATSGAYADLSGKPSLATVATSGAYSDLTGSPDLTLKANLASPTLTGTPLAPTAAAGTNTTQIATTAHVFAERSNAFSLTNKTVNASLNTLSNIPASAILVSDTEVFDPADYVTVASPTFTGLLTTDTIKILSGSPGVGKVLTSDADGDATWSLPAVGSNIIGYRDLLFYDDFNRPNTSPGDLGTSTFGTAYELLGYGLAIGTAETKIINGRWVATRNGTTNETSYAIQTFTEVVRNIGGKFKWVTGNGGVDESVMIFIVGQLGSVNIVYNCVHIQVTRVAVSFDFFVNGSSSNTKTVTFDTSFTIDRDITADFTFVGNTCVYSIGGYTGTVVDARFNTQIGKYATWEPFFNSPDGVNALSVGAAWVDNAKSLMQRPLIASDGLTHSTTGTLSEVEVYSVVIPANTLGKNGYLRLEYMVSTTNNANAKVFLTRVGTVLIGYAQVSVSDGFRCVTTYSNRNSQILGVSPHPANNFQATGAVTPYFYSSALGREINWAVDNTLTIAALNSDITDTIGLEEVHLFTYQ